MRILSIIIVLMVLLLGASFAIINAADVSVSYFVGHFTLPLSLLLLAAFTLGIIVGMALMFFKLVRLKREKWYLSNQLKSSRDRQYQSVSKPLATPLTDSMPEAI